MNDLQAMLYSHTPSEEWHINNPGSLSARYEDLSTLSINGTECYVFDWKKTLDERNVGVIKETRFTAVPPHVNRDMELCYIYDGSCDFIVNKKQLSLKKGDVLICDTGVVRSSPKIKKEYDIIISMAFRKDFFDSVFLSRLPGAGPLTALLFDIISQHRETNKYLILPAAYAQQIRAIIELIYYEYHFSDIYSEELLEGFVNCLFLEINRGLLKRSRASKLSPTQDHRIIKALRYIETTYKTCTLASCAAELGFSANYLGNLLKAQTGMTFSQIKTRQQMSEAAYLLANTDRPISEISNKVGISNLTFFYQKFRKQFGETPKQYRSAAQSQ